MDAFPNSPSTRRAGKAPLFRDFAAHYRSRRKHRWKSSSLETFDIYLRNRLTPHFGRLRLDAIDHTRVSAWFDAASVDKPGAANRAFEILRAMLAFARQWGDIGEHVPDACANIVRNPRRPVARYLDRAELGRLGAAQAAAVIARHGIQGGGASNAGGGGARRHIGPCARMRNHWRAAGPARGGADTPVGHLRSIRADGWGGVGRRLGGAFRTPRPELVVILLSLL